MREGFKPSLFYTHMQSEEYFRFRNSVNPLYTRSMFEGNEATRHIENVRGTADIFETKFGVAEIIDGDLIYCDIELGKCPFYHMVYQQYASGSQVIRVWKAQIESLLVWQLNDPGYYDRCAMFNRGKTATNVIDDKKIINLLNGFKGDSFFQCIVYERIMELIKEEKWKKRN